MRFNSRHFLLVGTLAIADGAGVVALNNEISLSDKTLTGRVLFDVRHYEDLDFAFRMAVPIGWRTIVTDESVTDRDILEPGYAVAFESPRSGTTDRFADYIMVEITPGSDAGAFETDGARSKITTIDGKFAMQDQLALGAFAVQDTQMDLLVHQAVVFELGYTIGFYAIGEPSEEQLLTQAFEVMLQTFRLPLNPYSVS